jgi:hypothetical protein
MISIGFAILHISARNSDQAITNIGIDELFFRFPRSLVFYVSKFIVPTGLSPFYSLEGAHISWVDLVIYLSVVGGIIFSLMKAKVQKRLLLGGIAWFCVALLPQMKVIPYGLQFAFADRYFYFSGIGLIITVGVIAEDLLKKQKQAAFGLLFVFAVSFAYLSYEQSNVWRNSDTLWTRVVTLEPRNALAWNNLGLAQIEEHNLNAAKNSFYEAIKVDPKYDKPWVNLAFLYSQSMDLNSAKSALEQALQRNPTNRDAAESLQRIEKALAQ